MSDNQQLSMKTWQAGTYTTWAALGEIVVALKAGKEINWRKAEDVARSNCDDDMSDFVHMHLKGIRDAVEDAMKSE